MQIRLSLFSFDSGVPTGRLSGEVPFQGVELGPLLGKGGYGSVYRGIKDVESAPHQIVAIKVS